MNGLVRRAILHALGLACGEACCARPRFRAAAFRSQPEEA